ncbi:hypothetical protein UFOVP350_23 [uncultured Caudovirales phage]|uniref:Uncharacterized protein n=1 Tax=uncultured Caudovirales phage TaxID=2100421 RepID=A0A6J5M1C4_9CAUD|nr:hypothetical protein UFOVP350_23 [uncultured Caudovirales phage]
MVQIFPCNGEVNSQMLHHTSTASILGDASESGKVIGIENDKLISDNNYLLYP